jgi:hypothetical protein
MMSKEEPEKGVVLGSTDRRWPAANIVEPSKDNL